MDIKVNGVSLARMPSEYSVDIADLDDGATTTRTADGTLHRDRVATKRKINLAWRVLKWDDLANILSAVTHLFFEVTYPDPMTGTYETKTFYVGDRNSPVAISRNGTLLWEGLSMNLIEK